MARYTKVITPELRVIAEELKVPARAAKVVARQSKVVTEDSQVSPQESKVAPYASIEMSDGALPPERHFIVRCAYDYFANWKTTACSRFVVLIARR
jgi:hypothetical protein